MFCKNELDVMPGTYKCYGDVKYLRFKVRLEILKSSMMPLSNVEESGSALDPQYNEREEIEFSWNEKVFSPSEFKLYAEKFPTNSDLGKEYAEKIKNLVAEGTSTLTNRLFSYTSKDTIPPMLHRYMFYTRECSKMNFQAESLSTLLHQHLNNSTDSAFDHTPLPVRNIVDNNPSDELRMLNRSLISSQETMYIVADLSDKSRCSDDFNLYEYFEHLLVTIKWNKRTKTLTVIPDFAPFTTPGYKIEIDAMSDTRYIYRYWILNVSQNEDAASIKKIEKITDEFVSHHKNCTISMDFEMPLKNSKNIFIFGEIKKAVDFSNDNLFIQYFVSLPDGWSTENSAKLNGITPLSRCKKTNNTTALSYIFELKLFFTSATSSSLDGESVLVHENHGPQLFFEVCSLDGWKRFYVEGYAWTTLPSSSGRHQLILNSWRPAALSRREELKRYFIGTDPQILDISFSGFPNEPNRGLLSHYGLETVPTGSIHLELNITFQRGDAVAPSASTKRSLLADRKTAMLMNSVNHILEAFKKARQRMLLAREPIILHTE